MFLVVTSAWSSHLRLLPHVFMSQVIPRCVDIPFSTPIPTGTPTGPFITINGAQIHRTYLILNIFWITLSLVVLWPLVVLNIRRLYRRYLDNPKRLYALRVEWAHITVASFFATVGSIDACYIYFDDSRFMRDIAIGTCRCVFARRDHEAKRLCS